MWLFDNWTCRSTHEYHPWWRLYKLGIQSIPCPGWHSKGSSMGSCRIVIEQCTTHWISAPSLFSPSRLTHSCGIIGIETNIHHHLSLLLQHYRIQIWSDYLYPLLCILRPLGSGRLWRCSFICLLRD